MCLLLQDWSYFYVFHKWPWKSISNEAQRITSFCSQEQIQPEWTWLRNKIRLWEEEKSKVTWIAADSELLISLSLHERFLEFGESSGSHLRRDTKNNIKSPSNSQKKHLMLFWKWFNAVKAPGGVLIMDNPVLASWMLSHGRYFRYSKADTFQL